MNEAERAATIRAYHERTKHRLDRYAAGPSNLDWDAQPEAFREWLGTRHYPLPRAADSLGITWRDLAAARPPAPFDTEIGRAHV
jgi:hypothetical protein